MPKKTKPIQTSDVAEVPIVESTNEAQPVALTKEDYLKARATIQQFREEKKNKPKRPCSEKQLAALAAGRMKNKRFANCTKYTNH